MKLSLTVGEYFNLKQTCVVSVCGKRVW